MFHKPALTAVVSLRLRKTSSLWIFLTKPGLDAPLWRTLLLTPESVVVSLLAIGFGLSYLKVPAERASSAQPLSITVEPNTPTFCVPKETLSIKLFEPAFMAAPPTFLVDVPVVLVPFC